MENKKEKTKGIGIIIKVAMFFAAFIIVSLVINTIVTYRFQAKTFKELKCSEVESISEYLTALVEKEGQNFSDYVDYYKEHYSEMRIPVDLSEYQSAYDEFLDAFSESYPGKVLFKDIDPNEMSEELQLLYYTYYHEYWLLTFDKTLETFDISYAYFMIMHEENYSITYMIDAGGRIEDEDHPGYFLIGETFSEGPEEDELMWRTWTTGQQYHEVLEWTDEYGHTYTSFVPVWINGKKIGLVGSDILIERINREMLKRTIVLVGQLGLFLVLLTALLLVFIEINFILKIKALSTCVRNASADGKDVTAEAIRSMHFSRDEIGELSSGLADMLIDLDNHEKEVERVARMKTDFLANMSHELRTPMNAVLGMTDLILREKTNDNVENYANQIKSSGTDLLAIINDILDFSEIETGELEIVKTEYHPVEVINDVGHIMKNKLGDKPVKLDVDIDPELPTVLLGDAGRIRQILVNVAGNAVKFTNEGKITIRAAFNKIDEDNIILKLIFEDTGIGIKEEDKKRLFESFTQLDGSRSRNAEGTGLGLAITKHLAELMGGTLDLESEYGKGSTFTVEVPQHVVDWEPVSDVSKTGAITFTAPAAKVLVTDDNPVNLSIAEGLLEPLKMNITKASSGEEAVELCKDNDYDIIFMDHMMPEMDGVETMHAIREKYPEYEKKPIIALTANTVGNAREMLLGEGMDDFVAKPVDVKSLVGTVRKWIPDDLIVEMTEEEKARAELLQKEREKAPDLVIGDLDIKGAVTMLGGEGMLFKILKEYYRVMPDKERVIREAWENKDWETYTIEVHSLKSTSGQIGARELQRMAADLEAAGREANEAFINEHTEELLERYTGYRPVFEPFCEEKEEDDSNKPEADKEVLKKAFDDFKDAADTLDLDTMEEIVKELSKYRYPDDQKALFSKLKDAVANIDVDAALEIVEELDKK